MEVCYSALRMKEHVFHRRFIFFQKLIFSKRSPLIFLFFLWIVDNMDYIFSASLTSGKQVLPIEKNIFREKIKIVNFFKN